MKVAAIVQARMRSVRLPGKVLCELDGAPVIAWICQRLRRAAQLQEIVVATSDLPADDRLAEAVAKLHVQVFRGSERDVLDRYYKAANAIQADVIVRVTGDCPLIDPGLVDEVVEKLLKGRPNLQYASNIQPPTYPDGLDVEAFTQEALGRAWQQARSSAEREHVTLFMRDHPELFPQAHVRCDSDLSHYRWTLDEEQDYRFLSELVRLAAEAGLNPRKASWQQWLRLIERHPHICRLNGHILRNEGLYKSQQTSHEVHAWKA